MILTSRYVQENNKPPRPYRLPPGGEGEGTGGTSPSGRPASLRSLRAPSSRSLSLFGSSSYLRFDSSFIWRSRSSPSSSGRPSLLYSFTRLIYTLTFGWPSRLRSRIGEIALSRAINFVIRRDQVFNSSLT